MNAEHSQADSSRAGAADGQGFVAGTLVHTTEGLRPIEQIKVGDLVLSRPETGEGDVSFQPVTRVFEYEDREVYFLPITEVDENLQYHKGNKEESVAVTGGHPIWIDHYRQTIMNFETWVGDDVVFPVNGWVSVSDYYSRYMSYMDNAEEVNEMTAPEAYGRLADGRLVSIGTPSHLLKGQGPDEGVKFFDTPDWDGTGSLVVFSPRGAVKMERTGLTSSDADLRREARINRCFDFTSIASVKMRSGGVDPIRRKVYNLEVKSNHSYFVGELGLWVHNAGTKRTSDAAETGAPIGGQK